MEENRNPNLPPKKTTEEVLGIITKNMGWVMFAITAVLYIVFLYIYVKGFTVQITGAQVGIFSVISAVFGYTLKQLAVGVGRTKAKERPRLKALEDEYRDLLPQKKEEGKELQSGDVKLAKQRVKKALIAVVNLIVSAGLLVSFTIPGIDDPQFFLLGLGTLSMNIGMSFMGFAKTYDDYYENQVPYIVQEIAKIKESIKVREYELLKTTSRDGEEELRRESEPRGDQGISIPDGTDQASGSRERGIPEETHESESGLCGSSEDSSSSSDRGSTASTSEDEGTTIERKGH